MYPFSRSFSLSQVEGGMRYKYLVAQLLPPTFKSSAWRKIIWKNKEVCIYRTKFVSYLLLKLFKWSTFHQDEFQLERWPDVKWQDSKYWICCAFRKIVFFFFFWFSFVSLKIKVKRDISRKVRTEVDLEIEMFSLRNKGSNLLKGDAV